MAGLIFDREQLQGDESYTYIENTLVARNDFGKNREGVYYKLGKKEINVVVEEIFDDSDYADDERSNIFFIVIPDETYKITTVGEKTYINAWTATENEIRIMAETVKKLLVRKQIESIISKVTNDIGKYDECIIDLIYEFEKKLLKLLF